MDLYQLEVWIEDIVSSFIKYYMSHILPQNRNSILNMRTLIALIV